MSINIPNFILGRDCAIITYGKSSIPYLVRFSNNIVAYLNQLMNDGSLDTIPNLPTHVNIGILSSKQSPWLNLLLHLALQSWNSIFVMLATSHSYLPFPSYNYVKHSNVHYPMNPTAGDFLQSVTGNFDVHFQSVSNLWFVGTDRRLRIFRQYNYPTMSIMSLANYNVTNLPENQCHQILTKNNNFILVDNVYHALLQHLDWHYKKDNVRSWH